MYPYSNDSPCRRTRHTVWATANNAGSSYALGSLLKREPTQRRHCTVRWLAPGVGCVRRDWTLPLSTPRAGRLAATQQAQLWPAFVSARDNSVSSVSLLCKTSTRRGSVMVTTKPAWLVGNKGGGGR